MADQLRTFLIAMAKDETEFARFLKNPKEEAVKAGLSREEIAVLMQRNPHKIFEQLQQGRAAGDLVWVCRVPAPRRPVRRVQATRKTTARRRR
jgi:hypothetical protein